MPPTMAGMSGSTVGSDGVRQAREDPLAEVAGSGHVERAAAPGELGDERPGHAERGELVGDLGR